MLPPNHQPKANMNIKTEFRALWDPRLRSLACQVLLLRIPMTFLFLCALPIILIKALGYALLWVSERAEVLLTPAAKIHGLRRSLYTRAHEIKSGEADHA